MRKQLLLLKSLLVAVLLGVGTSAWADAGDVTTNVNITFDGTLSSATYTKAEAEVVGSVSGNGWNDGGNPKTYGLQLNDGKLQLSNGNMTFNFAGDAARDKDVVKVSFDLAYPYVYSATTDRLLQFVISAGDNAVVTENFNFNKGTISSTTMGMTTDYLYKNGSTTSWDNKVHFELTFNYETQKIAMTTACDAATQKNGEFKIDMPANTGAITKFYISMGSSNAGAGRYALFDNLLVQTTEGDYSTTKTITYAYEDQYGNDITDVVVAKGGTASATPETGDTYTPVYLSSFVDDDWAYDYTYASGGDAFTVNTDATITLVYTKSAHATTDVTVKYKNGDDVLKEDIVAEDYPVGKSITYSVRKYVLSDGTLYQSASGTSRTVNAAETIEESVSSSGISNVVFFSEGEECTNKTGTASTSAASLGSAGRFSGDCNICTLGSGKYQIYALIHVGNGSDTSADYGTATFKAGDFTGTKTAKQKTNNQSYTSDEFTLTGNTDITLDFGGGNASGVDYIYIQKTGDVVNFTLGADAGDSYKSYVTKGNTDFATLGVTAYIAKAADTTNGEVTLSTIATAPANTPVLLKGTKGEYATISTTTTSYDAPETNYLKAADGETAIGSNDAKYVLAYDNGWEFRHYNGTLSAGKVYLDLSTMGARATKFSFVFDDKTTGISDAARLKDKGQMTNGVFNLKGQRVKKAAKGLYIVNGKKYVK